ncbi:bola-like protein [Melanomma pulvis-pyrius CBS 109.77]|uniref:Bola-like protein n=1 Tax=Melanomma pulvis-pyrius CBS 109.77 TaxID=1314802 RepID=A0A6A6XGK9_9PLEO|nr:bola-like protein [Melanomma pulvis-pyrius CBS 109.77]
MAPSRALARSAASAFVRPPPRATLRLLFMARRISCLAAVRPTALQPGPLRNSPATATSTRSYSQAPEPPDYLNEAELHIFNKIKAELAPVKLEVQDISGGCGSMYALEIESAKFKGLPIIKQHKLVNAVLAEEIKSWHGVQLRTKAV